MPAKFGGGAVYSRFRPDCHCLAYDLSKEGYRALDVGHVDTMYEWFLRKATKSIPIEGKIVFNEERNKKA